MAIAGDDPIVVTGPANFSVSSPRENDENMLFIRGNRCVADLSFTEFNRLFNHDDFRSTRRQVRQPHGDEARASLELSEDDRWLAKYGQGSLRSKRVQAFVKMAID